MDYSCVSGRSNGWEFISPSKEDAPLHITLSLKEGALLINLNTTHIHQHPECIQPHQTSYVSEVLGKISLCPALE